MKSDCWNWKGGISRNYYKRIMRNKKRICERCDSETNINIHHKDRNQSNNKLDNLEILCSSCHRFEHSTDNPSKKTRRICPNCGRIFFQYPSIKGLYCNDKCYGEHKRRMNGKEVKCSNCGKIFWKKNSTIHKRNYCCIKCRREDMGW